MVEYIDGDRLEQVGGAFARNAALFRELFEMSPVAVFSTGIDHRFEMVNPTARLLLQRPIEELESVTLAEVVAPEHADRVATPPGGMGGGVADNVEVPVVRPDGSCRWVHLSLRSWLGPDGEVAGQVGLAQDITRQVMERQAAETAARHDALTGALNRRAFDERIATPVAQNTAVAIIDLNDFNRSTTATGTASATRRSSRWRPPSTLWRASRCTARGATSSRSRRPGGQRHGWNGRCHASCPCREGRFAPRWPWARR